MKEILDRKNVGQMTDLEKEMIEKIELLEKRIKELEKIVKDYELMIDISNGNSSGIFEILKEIKVNGK